ncbi:MAG: M20/M25/M40 family metallo-hydrolase, partial [Myxococcaceae bacterium]
MTDEELLALHRELVAIPSVSHGEKAVCDHLEGWLRRAGVAAHRFGDNLFASCGEGPVLCFNSHLDTVPPGPGWTRPPHGVTVEDGRVYGLGSNDAKASVAAMIASFLRLSRRALGARVLLTLVCEEETGGKGAEVLIPELARRGIVPEAVIVGEPTGLDVAIAQKGLLVLELREKGRACHAAHGRALEAPNALRSLARDLVALDGVDLGESHPELGPVTLEPTVAKGGAARNTIPAEASCVLDVRTNPSPSHAQLI